jgi:glycosyltransferase involved in cell wall biosynthesis
MDMAPWTIDNTGEMELKHPAAVSVFSFNVLPKVMGLVRFIDVVRAMPHVNFYVAGSGPHMNYVTSRDVPQNMRFVGRLSHPDGVRLFLKAADIFVHPSGLDATPSAVLEAQMMKKPVVATNTGGIPEIVCERSLLIEDGDIGAWARTIQSLLDHPEDRERLGERGRSFVQENFSIQKAASNLCNYIVEITGH